MDLLKKVFKKLFLFMLVISAFYFNSNIILADPKQEEVQLIIIVPVNPEYDTNALKQLDSNLIDKMFTTYPNLAEPSEIEKYYPADTKEYEDYLEIYEAYDGSSPETMLVDQNGYYYPTVTEILGTGDQEELITLSTKLVDYFLINEDGNVSTSGDTLFARVYSVVIASNNVSINEKNVKYEIAYRSYDTYTSPKTGDDYDVQHIVVSEKQDWVRLSDSTASLTNEQLESGDYTAVINGMSRTYLTDSPVFDNSLGTAAWDYYQDPGKLNLIPINPEIDYDTLSLIETIDGISNPVETLYLVNNTSDFSASIKGKLISTDAVYFSFIDSEEQIDISEYELNYLTIDIYLADGKLNEYSGTSIFSDIDSGIGGLIHNFAFEADYMTLLTALSDPTQDTFDIVFTGATNNGRTVTTVLDNIKLPMTRINNLTVTNNTTKLLWDSLGFDSVKTQEYSTANFINTGNLVSTIVKSNDGMDGNYAKMNDAISISLGYELVTDSSKYSFDDSIELSLNGGGPITLTTQGIDPSSGNTLYTFKLDTFSGNGASYINAGTVDEDSERIKILYIDNRDPDAEFAGISPQYINNSTHSLLYSSDEEGLGTTEEYLTTGFTGTRAYIDTFSYKNSESDIPEYNVNNTPLITGAPHTGMLLSDADQTYYRTVLGSSDQVIIDETGHTNDGGYHINKIMAVDKAGNVETENKTELSTIAVQIPSDGNNFDYYVDTISPVINATLLKTADFYSELDTVFGLPDELPFKNGDDVTAELDITDYNLDNYNITEDASIKLTNSYSFPVSDMLTLAFTVENISEDDTGEDYEFFTATAADKAGNISTGPVTGRLLNVKPSGLALEVLEDYKVDWVNSDTGILGISSLQAPDNTSYRFSKGAKFSNSSKPDIYITGEGYGNIDNDTNDEDNVQVIGMDINSTKKYYNHGNFSPGQAALNMADINSLDASINNFYLEANGKNTVKATPYGISGVKGNEYSQNVVVDTIVNSKTSGISTGTYRSSTDDYKFELDFSKVLEFAGVMQYRIKEISTKLNGKAVTTYSNSGTTYTSVTTTPSSTNLKGDSSIDNEVIYISEDKLKKGSSFIMTMDIIDTLGSQRDVEFTLLVPKGINLKAKAKNSNRIRNSQVKIVGETISSKGFGVETLEETGE